VISVNRLNEGSNNVKLDKGYPEIEVKTVENLIKAGQENDD